MISHPPTEVSDIIKSRTDHVRKFICRVWNHAVDLPWIVRNANSARLNSFTYSRRIFVPNGIARKRHDSNEFSRFSSPYHTKNCNFGPQKGITHSHRSCHKIYLEGVKSCCGFAMKCQECKFCSIKFLYLFKKRLCAERYCQETSRQQWILSIFEPISYKNL